MLDPQLFIFDIDGTLLTTDYQILPSTKEAMSLLVEGPWSAPIMLASARSPKAIDPICRELNLAPFYVSLNGALIVKNGRILYEKPMDQEAVQRIIGIGREMSLSVNVYSTWDWFIGGVNPWSTHEGIMVGYPAEVRDLETVVQAHKILLLGEQEQILDVQKRLQNEVPSVSAQLSIPHYLEIVDKEASKGHALDIVGELLDIDFRNMVAFGDGENDLAMLTKAGFAVAMGNAHPRVKEVANLVTSNNDQDGVLEAVRKILDLGGVGG